MKKKIIANLEKCYSIAPLFYDGNNHILVASEKTDRCIMFDLEGNQEATVWEGPGGVMTMVQVPGRNGEFLATQQFYSPNDSKSAKIIIASPSSENRWEKRTLVDLPYVHRFDILESGEENYLIACTLKSGHEYKDDWNHPGKIYVAKLPNDLSVFNQEHQLELKILKEGMVKNHGYYRIVENGVMSALICAENGIYRCYPPKENEEKWDIQQLLDTPASDAVLIDIDGDGKNELIVLSPFHGNQVKIYREIERMYQLDYEFEEEFEFLHAIWSGFIQGKASVVLGHRQGDRNLLRLTWRNDCYFMEQLDHNCGPANVYGFTRRNKDILIAANREIDEVALYEFD